jgi:hypothetical protein
MRYQNEIEPPPSKGKPPDSIASEKDAEKKY